MDRLRKNKGFTLLELIISLAIVGFVLLGLFRVINSTHRISTKNDRDIKALNILQSEIENLRGQIKKSPNEDGERVLFVEDEVENKKIEVKFSEDTNEAIVPEYSKIDKDRNSIYKINNLKIQRELITGNNQSVNKGFNDYKYTLNIKAILEDVYFSKKMTEINDVVILSSNSNIDEGGSGGEGEDNIPEPLSEYNIRVHNNENWNVDTWSIYVAEQTTLASRNERRIGDFNMKSTDKFEIRYSKENPFMTLHINDKQVSKISEFKYSKYSKLSFYISHTGVILNNVYINEKFIGDIKQDSVFEVDTNKDYINIKFSGFTKINEGDQSGPNGDIRSDIFIDFS